MSPTRDQRVPATGLVPAPSGPRPVGRRPSISWTRNETTRSLAEADPDA
jgi:hypothetical protein